MHVLIAVDSRHGATRGIGEAIAEHLESRGLRATLESADEVVSVAAYDAVVLGSAVYMGHWLQAARHLAAEEKKALLERPVWLFSSGPIGDPPFPDTFPGDVEPIAELTHARAHRLFGGKLDRSELGVLERAMVRASHAPEGDYRDWDDVREFADEIADALSARVITG